MDTTKTTEAIDQERRRLLGTAVMGIAVAGTASLLPSQLAAATAGEAIRPFSFHASEAKLADLRRRIKSQNTGQVSRLMKRLRTHGLIKKIGKTYKYYLTSLGKQAIALGLKLKNLYVIPELSAVAAR